MALSRSRPFPFAITGSISAVDPGRRRLQVGETVLEATGDLRLDRLTVGMKVFVTGEMDPNTGRARARSITSVVPAASASKDASETSRLLPFVRGVLDELGESEVACEVTSVEEHAAIRLWLPDEIGKEIHLSRRMLEWALVDGAARRTIRSVLQTGISILRSRRALHELRETKYQCRIDGTASADSHCTRCGQPMTEVPGEVDDLRRRHGMGPDDAIRRPDDR